MDCTGSTERTDRFPQNLFDALDIPVLEALTDSERNTLLRASRFVNYAANTVIYRKNDMAPPILLLSGAVKLYSETLSGKERVLHIVRSGHFIDLSGAFSSESSPVSAAAVRESRALEIDAAVLFRIAEKNALLCTAFLRNMAYRQRMYINKLIGSQGKISVAGRVAGWLLHRARMCGGNAVPMETTLTLLAGQMGITRESLSRELGRLVSEGHISRDRHTIVLLNPEALRVRADTD